MDEQNNREKLEQELRFLKESFEAEVISKEEFEKGKERIEQKLNELNHSAEKSNGDNKLVGKNDMPSEAKKEDAAEPSKEKAESNSADANKTQEPTTAKAEPIRQKEESVNNKKYDKFFKYAVVFVVLALIIFFSYSLINSNKNSNKASETKFAAACQSDQDCKQEGAVGACLSPGTKDAKCEFKEIPKTHVVVLNERKECFNCDPQRVLSILENWFGALDIKEVDYGSGEFEQMAQMAGIKALPAFILDSSIANSAKFGQFKQTFIKKNSLYALSEDAAGATFYFRRENISNRLDFFVIENDSASAKAESNLKEFLNGFTDIQFQKHLSSGSLAKELGIKTFPTFLINNRIRFSGIYPAETIKEDFCSINQNENCKKILSKNLI